MYILLQVASVTYFRNTFGVWVYHEVHRYLFFYWSTFINFCCVSFVLFWLYLKSRTCIRILLTNIFIHNLNTNFILCAHFFLFKLRFGLWINNYCFFHWMLYIIFWHANSDSWMCIVRGLGILISKYFSFLFVWMVRQVLRIYIRPSLHVYMHFPSERLPLTSSACIGKLTNCNRVCFLL